MPIVIPEDERQSLGLPTATPAASGPSMPVPPTDQGSISGWKRMLPSIIQLGATGLGGLVGGLGGAAGASQGFAQQAIGMMDQNRQRQIQAEDFTIKKAHDAIGELKTLRIPDLRGQVPDAVLENVMNLVREYNEALMETSPGKGTLTPAEAAKIVQHYGLLQGEIAKMKSVQADMDQQDSIVNKAKGVRQAEIGDIALGMADANKPQNFMGPPQEGAPMGNVMQNAQAPDVQNQAISEWARRNQPVEFPGPNGQSIPVAPEKAAPYMADITRQQHYQEQATQAAAANAVRMYVANLRADTQRAIASSGALGRWQQALSMQFAQASPDKWGAIASQFFAMAGGPPQPAGAQPAGVQPPPTGRKRWTVLGPDGKPLP